MDEGLELRDWEMTISMAREDSVQASEHEWDWGRQGPVTKGMSQAQTCSYNINKSIKDLTYNIINSAIFYI